MEHNNILEALKYIPAADLSYAEWVQVGMALKTEGYDWTVWDEWSRADSRYKQGECERKWRTFSGSGNPVSGGTIVQMAKESGFNPHPFEGDGCMDWNDVIEYDGDGVVYETPTVMMSWSGMFQTMCGRTGTAYGNRARAAATERRQNS